MTKAERDQKRALELRGLQLAMVEAQLGYHGALAQVAKAAKELQRFHARRRTHRLARAQAEVQQLVQSLATLSPGTPPAK